MPSDNSDENRILSDIPVSMPVVVQALEDADLNGFSFSLDLGILVSTNRPQDKKDNLKKLREWNW